MAEHPSVFTGLWLIWQDLARKGTPPGNLRKKIKDYRYTINFWEEFLRCSDSQSFYPCKLPDTLGCLGCLNTSVELPVLQSQGRIGIKEQGIGVLLQGIRPWERRFEAGKSGNIFVTGLTARMQAGSEEVQGLKTLGQCWLGNQLCTFGL